VNPTPPNKNRLKNAVNSVPVPDDLAARLRSKIHAQGLPSGARDRLKRAVKNVPVPASLDSRIRTPIPGALPTGRWLPRLAPVVVAAGVLAALVTAYQFGHLRLTKASQDAYIASVSSHLGALMRIGLRDHIHCSVFRKYPKNPPTAEEILNPRFERGVKPISPEYAGLIQIVRSLVPENYRMTLAHQCTYKGREYIHLSLKDESNMLSLVLTRKVNGESFRAENLLSALNESGIPMYQAGVQRFQISAFETGDYLVYFISDLGKQRNTDLMLALAPPVKGFLAKLEL
jgi:hypothetical protein